MGITLRWECVPLYMPVMQHWYWLWKIKECHELYNIIHEKFHRVTTPSVLVHSTCLGRRNIISKNKQQKLTILTQYAYIGGWPDTLFATHVSQTGAFCVSVNFKENNGWKLCTGKSKCKNKKYNINYKYDYADEREMWQLQCCITDNYKIC